MCMHLSAPQTKITLCTFMTNMAQYSFEVSHQNDTYQIQELHNVINSIDTV